MSCIMSQKKTNFIYNDECVSPTSNPLAGETPLVSCPQLLNQYVCCNMPYLETVFSVCNMGTQVPERSRNTEVTSTHSRHGSYMDMGA
jgi:hypothetical protein